MPKRARTAKPVNQEPATQTQTQDAAPAAATAAAAPSEATTGPEVPAVPVDPVDSTDAQNAAETGDLAKQLELANREVENLRSRLSAVSQADQVILQAQRRANEAKQKLAEMDAARKAAKQQADAAMADLLDKLNERMTGQTLFEWAANGAPEAPAAQPAPAQATAPAPEPVAHQPATEGATATTAAAVPPADDDEERPTAAPIEIPAGADPLWDATLGSISVRGDSAEEMLAVPPGIVNALAAEQLTTVRQVWAKLEAKDLKVKGVGSGKLATLETILRLWLKSGGDAKPAAPAASPAAAVPAAGVAAQPSGPGEPTLRICGTCGHEWDMPSEVMKCSECGEDDLIYDVGCYGEPNADCDGDLCRKVEEILIRIPKTSELPGIEAYGWNIMVVAGKDGLYRNGFEVLHNPGTGEDTVAEGRYPSILRGDATDRGTAVRLAFGDLRRAAAKLLIQPGKIDVWTAAAKAATPTLGGLDPLDKLEPANEKATDASPGPADAGTEPPTDPAASA